MGLVDGEREGGGTGDRSEVATAAGTVAYELLCALEARFLAQVAERAPAMARFAFVRLLFVRDKAEDGGLAATVRPHEARAVVVADDERGALDDIVRSERLVEFLRKEHFIQRTAHGG